MKHKTRRSLTTVALALTILTLAAVTAGINREAYAADRATTATHAGRGTVNSIDPAHGTVNLTHEPIESLGWPAMKMSFQAYDTAELQALRPGMRIGFDLTQGADGSFVISRIYPISP